MSPARQMAVILLAAFLGATLALGGMMLFTDDLSGLTNRVGDALGSEANAEPSGAGGGGGGTSALPSLGDPEEQIITSVYASAAPTVVFISTTAYGYNMFGQVEQQGQGSGSGVIISKEGYILTNRHVVGRKTNTLTVRLHDGTEYDATFKGTDTETDLAVIKLTNPPANLPVAALGHSSQLKIGQRAIAIGNPYGLSSSVTVGVISALDRVLWTQDEKGNPLKFESMIQTDAAINPGNSGGPLLNSRGEVIGVNSVIYTQSGGNQGIAFAIPIDFAKLVLSDLITYGVVQRPYLGVEMLPLVPKLATYLNLSTSSGLLIQGVVPGSPAALAGLRAGNQLLQLDPYDRRSRIIAGGDVMLSLNGKPLATSDDVTNVIRAMNVGDKVAIEVLRDGKRVTITAILAARPPED